MDDPPKARGHLPKAYLRFDPNLDSTHPAPGDMIAVLCAANRQPWRGRFKSPALASRVLGRALYRRSVERGDLILNGEGCVYVDGWDEWQEHDWTVGERMRRVRARKRHNDTHGS